MAILDNWYNRPNLATKFVANISDFCNERAKSLMLAFTAEEKEEVKLTLEIDKFHSLDENVYSYSKAGVWLYSQGFTSATWLFVSPLVILGTKLKFQIGTQEYIYEYSDCIPELNLKDISKLNERYGNALCIAFNDDTKEISFFRVTIPDKDYNEFVEEIVQNITNDAKKLQIQTRKEKLIREEKERALLHTTMFKPSPSKPEPKIVREEVSWKDRDTWKQELCQKQKTGKAMQVAKKEILERCKEHTNEILAIKEPLVDDLRILFYKFEKKIEKEFYKFREVEAEKLEQLNDDISTSPYRFVSPYHPLGKRGYSEFNEDDIIASLEDADVSIEEIADIMSVSYNDFEYDDYSDSDIDEIIAADHYGQL